MGDLGFLLSRASGLVARSANAALAPSGLRVRQYSVLTLVCDAPAGLSQRELADVLGLDPSQVVALVDELDSAGLVRRQLDPNDRRARLVTATAAGKRRYRSAALAAAKGAQERLGSLEPREQEVLRQLLVRIVDAASA
ncbi:MarR family winged helix-turn-helix transcriptional regulator [Mycolicibacterium sp. CBM1]